MLSSLCMADSICDFLMDVQNWAAHSYANECADFVIIVVLPAPTPALAPSTHPLPQAVAARNISIYPPHPRAGYCVLLPLGPAHSRCSLDAYPTDGWRHWKETGLLLSIHVSPPAPDTKDRVLGGTPLASRQF